LGGWFPVDKTKKANPLRKAQVMNVSKVALRLREQMCSFLGNLRLPKVARRFVLEALYGIVARHSVMLTEIGRSLNEPIPLIKTENRLSRQAARKGLGEKVTEFVIGQGAGRVGEQTLLVVDPSDIAKPYAEKMEYLARVYDGSEGKLADGYWLCQVVAVECGDNEIVPLVNHLWSQEAPGFKSENAEIVRCIDRVLDATEGRGILVYDRGGDRINLFEPLLERGAQFIVRLVGNRYLLWKGKPWWARDLARRCPLPYAETRPPTESQWPGNHSHDRIRFLAGQTAGPSRAVVAGGHQRIRRGTADGADHAGRSHEPQESVVGGRSVPDALAH
jgi:hypothetical protein